jgi:hypothetical protein
MYYPYLCFMQELNNNQDQGIRFIFSNMSKDSKNDERGNLSTKNLFTWHCLPLSLSRRWSDPASGAAACDAGMHGREWYEVQ